MVIRRIGNTVAAKWRQSGIAGGTSEELPIRWKALGCGESIWAAPEPFKASPRCCESPKPLFDGLELAMNSLRLSAPLLNSTIQHQIPNNL